MAEEDSIHSTATSSAKPTTIYTLRQALERFLPVMSLRSSKAPPSVQLVPRTHPSRLQRSIQDRPFEVGDLSKLAAQEHGDDTVLYLGYGSNLAAETFLGKRGIRPLSQVNIVAPSLALTFNLPGLPYSEPCFANSKYRDDPAEQPKDPRPPYHKNAWKKGLVGVVYEVTQKDYAHIIATEGGGASYQDIVVDCYALSDDPDTPVPEKPTSAPFKAHTLYAHREKPARTDPDYAQPSARYLKLITDGAVEHNLPSDYRYFLSNIRSYHTTTIKQKLGGYLFLMMWGPLFLFIFGGGRIFQDKNGIYPKWFAVFAVAVFTAAWGSYDEWFKKLFGEGERTIGDDVDFSSTAPKGDRLDEKTPLLPTVEQNLRISSKV